jgi:hypothetical protein
MVTWLPTARSGYRQVTAIAGVCPRLAVVVTVAAGERKYA